MVNISQRSTDVILWLLLTAIKFALKSFEYSVIAVQSQLNPMIKFACLVTYEQSKEINIFWTSVMGTPRPPAANQQRPYWLGARDPG